MIKHQLSGSWTLKPSDNTLLPGKKNVTVQFPGDIHSALISQNIIPDPYYGKNELAIQWVGKTDWICEKEITVKKNFIQGQQFIVLDTADTYVHVLVNNTEVGFCDNYFKKWRFNISTIIKEGKNTITLVFDSAEKHAVKEASVYPYPVPCSSYDVFSPNRNFSRKPQCHSGWDWGPCLMVSGIYSSIELVQTVKGLLDYVETKTTKMKDEWLVELTAHYTALTDCAVTCSASLSGSSIAPLQTETQVKVHTGENRINLTMSVKNPELWYPSGCRPEDDEAIMKTGRPSFTENTMYQLCVKAADSSLEKKIAFRTLETVSKKDKDGLSLYFKVNGRTIFSKGSNWIPLDALPSRHTPERYEHLLDSLVKANMNTVRVWGGGMYEKDCFYEICDRKGILIWHDFMFACGLYPTNKKFLDSVRSEVQHQVLRLKDHPSIALWCGNNENLGALNWYSESKRNRDLYLRDYDRLYEGVVGDEVKKNDPERMWWPSSPCAGPDNFEDNWKEDSKGDMHYWDVWHGKKSFDAYYSIKPRFVSEFGYQSFPSYSTVKTYASEEEMNLTSPVMEFHQRSPCGNAVIIENFARYFRFPKSIKDMLYLSQVQQSLAMRTAIDYWRSLRPYCLGSIIWQLNDNCPVASWSSIEYMGKWKLLHYDAAKFFAPAALSLYIKDSTLYAYGLNDTQNTIDALLTLSFTGFDGKKIDNDIVLEKQLASDSSTLMYSCTFETLPSEKNTYAITGSLTSSLITSNATVFPSLFKHCELLDPEISAEVIEKETKEGKVFEIQLSCKNPAFFVSLDSGSCKGIFSDNLFTLLPSKKMKIIFTPENSKVSFSRFKKELTLYNLRGTY